MNRPNTSRNPNRITVNVDLVLREEEVVIDGYPIALLAFAELLVDRIEDTIFEGAEGGVMAILKEGYKVFTPASIRIGLTHGSQCGLLWEGGCFFVKLFVKGRETVREGFNFTCFKASVTLALRVNSFE